MGKPTTIYFYENRKVERASLDLLTPLPAGSSERWCLFRSWHRYVIFLNEQRSQLRAKHPGLPCTEITKMLAAQWAQLSQEQKQVSPFLQRMRQEVAWLSAASIRGCSLLIHLFSLEPERTFRNASMRCLSPHPFKAIPGSLLPLASAVCQTVLGRMAHP